MTPREFQESFHAARAQVQRVIVGLDPVVRRRARCAVRRRKRAARRAPRSRQDAARDVARRRRSTSSHRGSSSRPTSCPPTSRARTSSSRTSAASKHFSLHKGPVFANVILADEINRATPKTQSALLEAMQERAGHARSARPSRCRSRSSSSRRRTRSRWRGPTRSPRRSSIGSSAKLKLTLPSEDALLAILERTTGTARDRPTAALDARADPRDAATPCARSPCRPRPPACATRILLCTHPEHPDTPDARAQVRAVRRVAARRAGDGADGQGAGSRRARRSATAGACRRGSRAPSPPTACATA